MASQTEKDTAEAASKTQKRSPHTQTRSPHTQTRSPHTQTESVDTQKRSPDTVLSKSHSDYSSSQNARAVEGSRGGERGTAEGEGGTRSRQVAGLDASARYIPEATNRARESAANLLPRDNMGGGRDPFYIFDRTISSSDPIDYGLYDIPPASNFATEEEEKPTRPARPTTGFSIVKSFDPDDDEKVVVLEGVVILSNNGDEATAPQTNADPLNATTFNFGDTLFLNITATATSISCAVSTSEGNFPIRIGSVSSDGVITQALTSGVITVEICGDSLLIGTL